MEERRDLVGSLQRGLGVLEILAAHPSGLTLTQTAEHAGITRAAARRFLLTLAASGYATQHGRTFRLSPRLISLARTWLSGASLWSFAEPWMREVSQSLNESCSAAVLADEDVVYVARVAGARILSVALHVGTHLPAYCTSMGRVLLSEMDDDSLERFLSAARIEAKTPKTVTSPEELGRAIRRVREQGYALVDEELEFGLRSIAVPVRDRSGRVAAAINVSTHAGRTDIATMKRDYLPRLRQAARRIEDFFVVQ